MIKFCGTQYLDQILNHACWRSSFVPRNAYLFSLSHADIDKQEPFMIAASRLINPGRPEYDMMVDTEHKVSQLHHINIAVSHSR